MAKESTRDTIIRCAINEFGTQGFHLATLDRIAKKAQVQKPLILYYFKDKSALLQAAIEEILVEQKRRNDELNSLDLDARARADMILEANFVLADENTESARLMLVLYASAGWDKELNPIYKKVVEGVRTRYGNILKAGAREKVTLPNLDVERWSRTIHFWIIGAITDYLSDQTARKKAEIKSDWKALLDESIFRTG
ncbi:MAG: TetR family transcriptional regulator [Bdellovibrionales bacterium]|nr:TetR family transcriptional regulator [Bdellovibrionales bacterium]